MIQETLINFYILGTVLSAEIYSNRPRCQDFDSLKTDILMRVTEKQISDKITNTKREKHTRSILENSQGKP